eukprot:CAMPEP_0206057892 /NCGR_PEP_ID=MMETSP1466-20131121/45371_1 /ASSEMBLY_ACC=CAM_ASM_001126 /TAXON_ID=44452 /ORGANISM="Pavlova gyrans, Strain CCMP608" /LENGTH=48 /DNA_ID= /DNA_START= /DNA_END= /DNA_ORIENTATION=
MPYWTSARSAAAIKAAPPAYGGSRVPAARRVQCALAANASNCKSAAAW